MKEHESREINVGEDFSWLDGYIKVTGAKLQQKLNNYIYVDSNNFLHNFESFAYDTVFYGEYWIHGKRCKNKEEFDLERNRILILEEI